MVIHGKENLGTIDTRKAFEIANANNIDVMLVGERDGIPTLKLLDFGAISYKNKKKSRKQVKARKPKVFKIRPNIGIGDLKNKAKASFKSIEKGHDIVISVILKGRENAYLDLGIEALEAFKDEIKSYGEFTMVDKIDGNNISCIISK